MKELLDNIGINSYDSFIYEYDPIKLDWWDPENKTSIEIELHQNEESIYSLSIVFSPEIGGIVERTIIYTSSFSSDALFNQTLIDKKVCETLISSPSFGFSNDQNAYLISSYDDAKSAFNEISNLIINKNPIFTANLQEAETDEDIVPYELGDTLDHFIAMMDMNSSDFSKDEIIENIELSITLEGTDYFSELKKDVNNEYPNSFRKDYNLDDQTITFLKTTIRNYNQQGT